MEYKKNLTKFGEEKQHNVILMRTCSQRDNKVYDVIQIDYFWRLALSLSHTLSLTQCTRTKKYFTSSLMTWLDTNKVKNLFKVQCLRETNTNINTNKNILMFLKPKEQLFIFVMIFIRVWEKKWYLPRKMILYKNEMVRWNKKKAKISQTK